MSEQRLKEIKEKFIKDGGLSDLNDVLSAAYLLQTEQVWLIELSKDILKKYGISIGRLNNKYGNFSRAADVLLNELFSFIGNEDVKQKFIKEYQGFHNLFMNMIKVRGEMMKNSEGSEPFPYTRDQEQFTGIEAQNDEEFKNEGIVESDLSDPLKDEEKSYDSKILKQV